MKEYQRILWIVFIVSLILVAVSCDDDPVSPTVEPIEVLAMQSENCNFACGRAGGTCDVPGLIRLNDDQSACYTALVAAGMPGYAGGPMGFGGEIGCHWGYDIDENADFWGYGPGATPTCDAGGGDGSNPDPTAGRRMCACMI